MNLSSMKICWKKIKNHPFQNGSLRRRILQDWLRLPTIQITRLIFKPLAPCVVMGINAATRVGPHAFFRVQPSNDRLLSTAMHKSYKAFPLFN
jgi:hypothetical protein